MPCGFGFVRRCGGQFCFEAVQTKCEGLEHADNELRGDREILFAVVNGLEQGLGQRSRS